MLVFSEEDEDGLVIIVLKGKIIRKVSGVNHAKSLLSRRTKKNVQALVLLFSGLFTVHGNGTGTGTGNWTSTIGNNGSWFLSLCRTSENISVQYTRTHLSHSLYLSRSRSRAVWINYRGASEEVCPDFEDHRESFTHKLHRMPTMDPSEFVKLCCISNVFNILSLSSFKYSHGVFRRSVENETINSFV